MFALFSTGLTKEQCAKIREILDYEKEFGTEAAARHFSNTWGDDRMGEAFNNKPVETAAGTIDLDWYTDLRSTGAGPATVDAVYATGKSIWNAGKYYAGLYFGDGTGNPKTQMQLPYEDPKERGTLAAIQAGFDSFSSLFPESFMAEKCCN